MVAELYTPREVAKIVRVRRTTLYQHIKKGQLKAIRIGNQYRITKAQLEEYLQENTDAGTKSAIDPRRDGETTI